MTAPLSIDVFTYDSSHAATLHTLVERAFSIAPPHARPKDSREYLDYMQGPANPGGPSIVAAATMDGICVGNISATPFRFTTRAGQRLCAYQLGSVAVDARHQRQGIGGKLVRAITEHLAAIPDSFTYIYPNTRSDPVLRRAGYAAADDIPTYVLVPSKLSFATAAQGARLTDRRFGAWHIAQTDLAGIMAMADDWPAPRGTQPGFARDRDFFAWRFAGPGADTRYRFLLCRAENGSDTFAAVLAHHVFSGFRFAVLVDLLSPAPMAHYGLALKAAQVAGGLAAERFVYVNSNLPRLAQGASAVSSSPLAVRVPDAVNPRPVRLLYFPRKGMALREEIDAGMAMTGDWMGF